MKKREKGGVIFFSSFGVFIYIFIFLLKKKKKMKEEKRRGRKKTRERGKAMESRFKHFPR